MSEQLRPEGIEGVDFKGPFAVGRYAKFLQERMREIARVQVFGEVFNLRRGRGAKVYFELRDGDGALPCSMWRNDFEKLGPAADAVVDGAQIVVAGGPDYYPGSRTSSPSFSFQVTGVRVAGEGDLLAQLDRLRKALAAEGLFEPQKALHRPVLPRTIGVVTGEGGKARDDVLAGLRRRGWGGPRRLGVRAGAGPPRRAADHAGAAGPRRGRRGRGDRRRARRRLARRPVRVLRRDAVPDGRDAARAGDRVGRPPHRPHADRRRRRGVAARRRRTPPSRRCRCTAPRRAATLARGAGVAAAPRAPRGPRRARGTLAQLSRAPAEHVARHRARAAPVAARDPRQRGRRGCDRRARATSRTRAVVLERKVGAAAGPDAAARRARPGLAGRRARARTTPSASIARGYAIVEDREGEP